VGANKGLLISFHIWNDDNLEFVHVYITAKEWVILVEDPGAERWKMSDKCEVVDRLVLRLRLIGS